MSVVVEVEGRDDCVVTLPHGDDGDEADVAALLAAVREGVGLEHPIDAYEFSVNVGRGWETVMTVDLGAPIGDFGIVGVGERIAVALRSGFAALVRRGVTAAGGKAADAFTEAEAAGDAATIEMLLRLRWVPDAEVDRAVSEAIERDNVPLLVALLAGGAPVPRDGGGLIPISFQFGDAGSCFLPSRTSCLVHAARYGSCGAFRVLLAQGVACTDAVAEECVDLAVLRDSAALLQLLMDAGVAAARNHAKFVWQALHTARRAVLDLVLAGGRVDPNGRYHGTPMLVHCAFEGHLAATQALVEAGARLEVRNEEDSLTPLMAAATSGHHAVAAYLAAAPGVDLQAKDARGNNVVALAARHGHDHVLRTLLECGARPARNQWRETALMQAARGGEAACVRTLLAYGGREGGAMSPTAGGGGGGAPASDGDPVSHDHGRDQDQDQREDPPPPAPAPDAALAAYSPGNPHPDVLVRDRHRHTPLTFACLGLRSWARPSRAAAFMPSEVDDDSDSSSSGDADSDAMDVDMECARHTFEVVRVLVAAGADVNAWTQDRETCAVLAAGRRHWPAVRWLIAHGCDVNATSAAGESVLIIAADDEDWDMVRWLVSRGAVAEMYFGDNIVTVTAEDIEKAVTQHADGERRRAEACYKAAVLGSKDAKARPDTAATKSAGGGRPPHGKGRRAKGGKGAGGTTGSKNGGGGESGGKGKAAGNGGRKNGGKGGKGVGKPRGGGKGYGGGGGKKKGGGGGKGTAA